MNQLSHGDAGQMLAREAIWVRIVSLIGLGTLLIVLGLLPGCGSNDGSKATAKKEKAAKAGSGQMTSVLPLLGDKGGAAKTAPQGEAVGYPGMPPMEELRAKAAEAAKYWDKADPKTVILPGLTLEKAKALIEADRAKKLDPKAEVLPGLTLEQAEAKRMQQHQPGPADEILPGLTLEKANAKAVQAKQEAEGLTPDQVLKSKQK